MSGLALPSHQRRRSSSSLQHRSWPAVRAGERIRLRLINAANARIFGLEIRGHQPQVIALDGQPVDPHEPAENRIVLGPAQRADLVIDMTGAPGATHAVVDTFYEWPWRMLARGLTRPSHLVVAKLR
jgi:FtsP/CotA-like multicopper oxidase with cupredoxin domain